MIVEERLETDILPLNLVIPNEAFIAKKSGKHYQIVIQERKGNTPVLSVIYDFDKAIFPKNKPRRSVMREVSKKLGLQICEPSSTPLAVECRRARKAARKQALIDLQVTILAEAEQDLKDWIQSNGLFKDVAIAELVRYCNRFAKCFPRYKERTNWQNEVVDLIYSLKDAWIEENISNCIQHCKSSSFTHTYIDWDELHFQKDLTGDYQYAEDFEVTETTNFYAYTFVVDGVEFKFHSQFVLFEEDEEMDVSSQAEGSAKPLENSEKVLPVLKACAMLSVALNTYDSDKKTIAVLSMNEK